MQHSRQATTATSATPATKKDSTASAVAATEQRLSELPPADAAEAKFVGNAAVEDSDISYAANADTNVIYDNTTLPPADSKLADHTKKSDVKDTASVTKTTTTADKGGKDTGLAPNYGQQQRDLPAAAAKTTAATTTTTTTAKLQQPAVAVAAVTSPAPHLDRHDEHFTEEQRQRYVTEQQQHQPQHTTTTTAATGGVPASIGAASIASTTGSSWTSAHSPALPASNNTMDREHHATTQHHYAPGAAATAGSGAGLATGFAAGAHKQRDTDRHEEKHFAVEGLRRDLPSAQSHASGEYGNHHRTEFEKQPVEDTTEECDRCEKHMKAFEKREGIEHGDKSKKFGEIPRSQQIDLGAHAGEEQHPTHFEGQQPSGAINSRADTNWSNEKKWRI